MTAPRRVTAVVAGLGCLLVATACTTSQPRTLRPPIRRNVVTRYKHIVIDLLENHSFDSILGQYCTVRRSRVAGASRATGSRSARR